MALIVSTRPNGGYRGKCRAKAEALVKSGTRVGCVCISLDDPMWYCHICKQNHKKPVFTTSPVDEMQDCPGCKTPFVFWEPF